MCQTCSVNLSQKRWKQETWGHELADVKCAWRGHNILKNSLCVLKCDIYIYIYIYKYIKFLGCNVSLSPTLLLLPSMVLLHMTKITCWLVTMKIQMYLSNAPEQGLYYFSTKEIRKWIYFLGPEWFSPRIIRWKLYILPSY